MKNNRLALSLALASFILPVAISQIHQSALAAERVFPRISFEKTVFDLGDVGQGTRNTCEFRFTNTGRGLLKIGKISRTCGCTVIQLDKKEYAPIEAGTIKVIYTAGKSTATTQKSIYVSTNDKDNPRVKLTVKANIVQLVEVKPQKLELSLRNNNACIPDIRLASRDGKQFSIKAFQSTNHESIAVDFDPNVSASQFILQPKADIEQLKKQLNGLIEIKLTHPQCRSVLIPYEVLAEFKAIPRLINLVNAEPQKAVTREIIITSNYGEDFEIESTSSKNGYIKVLSWEKVEKSFKFSLQITPPPPGKGRFFSDVLYVNIKGKDKLAIDCRGYFPKQAVNSKKTLVPEKDLVKFKVEPQVVKIQDAEPGKALIKEVLLSSSDKEDFAIESVSSQKGTIELLSKEKVGDNYKLKLKITPPPSKHRLEIFSDVLYVNIRGGKSKIETTKLPIACRGSYSRSPMK